MKIDKGDKYSNIISTAGATTIVPLPLTFVHSGGVNIIIGLVNVTNLVGGSGNGWSRTSSSSYAYSLNFNASNVSPSNDNNRYNFGLTLRCLYPSSA